MVDNAHTRTDGEPLEPLIPEIRVTPRERKRLLLVGLALLVVGWLLVSSLDALGPFILALVLAYLMLPLVERLHRNMPRVVAILFVYVVFVLIVALAIAWLAPLITNQLAQFSDQAPAYGKQLQRWGEDFSAWYNSLPLSEDVRRSLENGARNMLSSLGGAIQQGVVGALQVAGRAMGFVVGLIIIPFWLFYVLKDKDRGMAAFNNMLPRSWRNDTWHMVRIVNGILSSYIRGQLLLGLLVGVATTVGLLLVGAPYAIVLGIISGFTELIPILGPVLGAIPGLAVALLQPDGWVLALKVLLVYLVVQQLENNLLVPKIQGDSVKLHPAIIMMALVVGSQVGGLFGLIVAVPLTAMLRDVYLYAYRRLTEDFTPRQAEASVPSRQEEESEQGKKREAAELTQEHKVPGVNSATEMLADLDEEEEREAALLK